MLCSTYIYIYIEERILHSQFMVSECSLFTIFREIESFIFKDGNYFHFFFWNVLHIRGNMAHKSAHIHFSTFSVIVKCTYFYLHVCINLYSERVAKKFFFNTNFEREIQSFFILSYLSKHFLHIYVFILYIR